jgi:RecA-family ATPase
MAQMTDDPRTWEDYTPDEPDWITAQYDEPRTNHHSNGVRRREVKQAQKQEQNSKARSSSKFQVVRMSDVMALPPQEWVMDRLIYEDSTVVVFGEPGSAKSFLAFGWFACLALGCDWQGHKVNKSGLVIYTAAEGARGYQRRALALAHEMSISVEDLEDNFMWITTSVHLDQPGSVRDYIDAINEARGDREILALCIDTLFQCAGGVDINSPAGMSALMDAVKYIKDQTGASIVTVVHHSGKDKTRGAMGNMALKAACDLMYEVEKNELTNVVTLRSHKVKDDEPIEKTFVLKKVVYGAGPRDHSCVVVSSESQIEEKKRSFAALPFKQQQVLDILGDNQYRNGEWRELCELQGIKRRTFEESIKALLEKNLVHKVEPDKNTSPYRKGPSPTQEHLPTSESSLAP